MKPSELLQATYAGAMKTVGSDDFVKSNLKGNVKKHLQEILNRFESSKAVLTVLITSLIYKTLHPTQDIRNHQASIENGYSGRSFDTKHITPFIKSVQFPFMKESGWFTQSLNYYLRLLANTSEFIENYVNLLEKDTALKFEHKKQWNTIISEM